MPLKEGSGKKVIGQNISELRHSGYPEKQAIAISMHQAGKSHPKHGKAHHGPESHTHHLPGKM